MKAIYLASKSPRRADLLNQLEISFETVDGEIDETPYSGENPLEHVKRLAIAKATAGWLNSAQDRPVLGSDTIVTIGNEILGKPKDFEHAKKMWHKLSGQTHQVMTAIALVNADKVLSEVVVSEVLFATLTEAQMQAYWQTAEPIDKAGAYAIQGIGGQFIVSINGSYSAIVGLPMYQTSQLLARF